MRNTMKKTITILNILILFLFANCTTTNNKPECLKNGKMDKVELRWGGMNYKKNLITGYKIDAKSNLYAISQVGKNQELRSKEIGKITPQQFCSLIKEAQSIFLKVQALNVFADSSNFVEFINPELNSTARAVWNAKFKTFGSKEFRDLLSKLDSLVINNKTIILKKGENPSNSVK